MVSGAALSNGWTNTSKDATGEAEPVDVAASADGAEPPGAELDQCEPGKAYGSGEHRSLYALIRRAQPPTSNVCRFVRHSV
jgi:hypothetical protein